MAKQNFLAGGFYGKLGATVGQRWKNKRTIRTYVVPGNPRTPAQVANRNKFSDSVPFAQKGMSMNYRSPAFTSETTTEWALRMSAAKYAVDLGLSDVAIIPVVPRGFTSVYTITEINLESVIDATHARLSLVGTLPAGSKSYSLMVYFYDGVRKGEYMLCEGVSDANDNTLLTVTCENTASLQSATTYGVIVSKDDVDAQTVTYSARLVIKKQSLPAFAQTVSITSVSSDNNGGFAVVAQMGVYGSDLVGEFTYNGVLGLGTYKTKQSVFNIGGEEYAQTSEAAGLSWIVENFVVNKTTGLITFTVKPTNYEDIHSYDLRSFTMGLGWTNAYTSDTSMSSGRCQGNTTTTPTYTQPQLDMSLAVTPPYMAVSEQIEGGYGDGTVYFELVNNAAKTAWEARHPTNLKLNLVSGMSNVNLIVDGVARTGVFDWDDVEVDLTGGGTFNCYLNTMEVAGVTSGTVTSGTTNAFVSRMCLSNSLAVKAGTYDANHIWTPLPDWSIPADTAIGLY